MCIRARSRRELATLAELDRRDLCCRQGDISAEIQEAILAGMIYGILLSAKVAPRESDDVSPKKWLRSFGYAANSR